MTEKRFVIVSDFDDVMCDTIINWGKVNGIDPELLHQREYWKVDKSLGLELGTYVSGVDYTRMDLNVVGKLLWKYHQLGIIDLYIISATTGDYDDKDEAKRELLRKACSTEFVEERVRIIPATESKGKYIKQAWGLEYIDLFIDDKYENHLDIHKTISCIFHMAPQSNHCKESLTDPYIRFYASDPNKEEKRKADFARVLIGCIANKEMMMEPTFEQQPYKLGGNCV